MEQFERKNIPYKLIRDLKPSAYSATPDFSTPGLWKGFGGIMAGVGIAQGKGEFRFKLGAGSHSLVVGLSLNLSTDTNFKRIDFIIYFFYGSIRIHQKNNFNTAAPFFIGYFGSYTIGDLFQLRVDDDGYIGAYQNGNLFAKFYLHQTVYPLYPAYYSNLPSANIYDIALRGEEIITS